MKNNKFRIEKDTMGEMQVPHDSLYGAQTARAVDNFPVSGLTFPPSFIKSLAIIKKLAAETNFELGLLEKPIRDAICNASEEIIDGELNTHFIVDIFQTGSGTSTNMNMNEVISNSANLKLGEELGSKKPVHPNDHIRVKPRKLQSRRKW